MALCTTHHTRKFTPNSTICYGWFKKFNAEYFNNELPVPDLLFNTAKYWGQFRPRTVIPHRPRCIIVLSVRCDRTERDFQNTFIHEMIHLWQFHTQTKDKGHGADFKRKAAEINAKGGWNIKRCSDSNGAEVLFKTPKRTRNSSQSTIVITWFTKNGVRCYNKFSNTCAKRIIDWMRNNPQTFITPTIYRVPTDGLEKFRTCNGSGGIKFYSGEHYWDKYFAKAVNYGYKMTI